MLPDNTKERRLAESIIDRHVRGILIKYIEKGYIDSQVNRIGGRVKTSDGNDVTYDISVTGETGKERYIIKYLLPDVDADRTRSLSDNGEMFMRLIKPVLSHLKETIENLPAIDLVCNSLNKETANQLIDHLNNPPDKLFYSLATSSSGENPLIKRLKPSKGQIVNYKIALKAYMEKGLHSMNTDEVEVFRGCAGMLPLMRESRIAWQLQEYLPAPDSTLRIKNDDIERAFCKKYGKNNFSEIIENQLGDFSLLTKKQQESFLKYVQSIFVSFPDIAAGEQSDGIKLSCSHFPFNDNLFERMIDELKYKKLMTLSKIFKSIIGEFPSPPYGTVMPVSFRPYITGFNGDHCLTPEENRLATNLTSALRSIIDDYVLFKVSRNIIEGIGKKADVPTDLPVVYAAAKSLFVDGALKALEEMISHIGSGPNAELVKIMRREVEIKKKKNKIMSEEMGARKIIDSVAAFTRRFGDILDEKKKVLYNPIEETANEGHRVGLKIDDDVFATLIFNVRNVYYDGDTNSSSNLDSVELEFIEENNKYILGTLWENGFHDTKAVVENRLLKIIRDGKSGSRPGKFTKLFRERPTDLARYVENSCTAYADSYEDFLKKRILADKDDFYKVFQEEFPEELAEEFFCATPVSPGMGM